MGRKAPDLTLLVAIYTLCPLEGGSQIRKRSVINMDVIKELDTKHTDFFFPMAT